ncbi:MAG: apolipoprotein N-acyltransferase [Saprospiraceae bacterium]
MIKKSIIPYKIPILAILAIIATVCGYQMWQLPLWSHRPILLFTAVWGFIMVALADKYSKLPKNGRYLSLATLSGILLGFGFPISPLTPLMFVGFVPLLMIEKEIAAESEATSKWEIFKYSYHAFVVWNIITTYWVANASSFAASLIAIWLNAFFMTIPFVLFHQTRKVMPRDFMYIAFIANWLSWEYLHLRWEISWPWLTLGNSFAQYPSWVQWYEYTGVFGGSLWILLANVLIFRWLASPFWQEKIKIEKLNILKVIALIILPIILSIWRFQTYQPEGKEVEVVVVQPNYEPHYQKFEVSKFVQLDQFLKLSESKLTQNTAYLVFPETSFDRIDRDQMNRLPVIEKLQDLIDKYPNLKLVMGVDAYQIFREKVPERRSMRQQKDGKTGKISNWEAYNAAVQLESGSDAIQFYKKGRFVPGAEIFPYPGFFFFVTPIVSQLGGTVAGLGTQERRIPFASKTGKVGAAICYESVYGEFFNGYVRNGANAIFIITNDGWWDDTPGYQQHLKFASLRAIETRKDIARSANTGTSAFINQKGEVLQATNYEEATAIRGTVQFNDTKTFYVQWGDMIGRIAIYIFALLILNTFVKGKMNKNKS